ncbi:glycosyltransferase family 61 protein [Sphingobium yanoikuyae]|uniref:glycosyltransferase family 61 protein n=1 Tax=Sphingobium yanoikuyae TaxID=13690 RepID=UPI0013785BEA|nr:glycosyltransferase 61 family protein [Sphingobium yanoikuyae]NBB37629.1 DUF563 domain-containing protein [Sphingobium yanoikuyae]
MTSSTAISPDEMLKKCQAWEEQQAFREIVDALSDYPAIGASKQLLKMFVVTAIAIKDEAALSSDVTALAVAMLPDSASFTLIKNIDRPPFRDIAAKLVLSKNVNRQSPLYMQQLKRCVKDRDPSKLSRQLRKAIAEASKGGNAIRPEASGYDFPERPANYTLGTVDIMASSTTDQRHFERLQADTEIFAARLNAPRDFKVHEYRNVFIDNIGQIWNEDGAIIESRGHEIPNVSRYSVPNLDIGFNLVTKTRGLYHFLVDRISLLGWMINNPRVACIPVLTNAHAPAFERELLELASLEGPDVHAIESVVFVERLLVATGGFAAMAGWKHVAPVMDRIVTMAHEIAYEEGIDLPSKIYISRSLAKRRVMENEEQVHEAMEERGVAVLHFENLPIWQQIAIASNAQTIIAPHGAGLAHLITAIRPATVVEILPISDAAYVLRWNYARVSQLRGHSYTAWLEEQPNPLSDRWSTNLDEFLPFLDAKLGLKASTTA